MQQRPRLGSKSQCWASRALMDRVARAGLSEAKVALAFRAADL